MTYKIRHISIDNSLKIMREKMANLETQKFPKAWQHPTLSVTMSNYNHSSFVGKALEAIISQSYKPLEIIIIDDGSTDNSVEIIFQLANREKNITFIENKKNMGIFHNSKKLIELVKGDYVYFAAADDKILPGFFEKSVELLTKSPQAGLCSTLSRCIAEDGSDKGVLHMPIISNKGCFIPPDKALSLLRRHGSWMQGNTTILRRHALIDSGGFIPELQSFCDGFIYMVIAAKYGVCFIPEPLAAWRQVEKSYSTTCGKDPELSLQIVHRASELMSSKYGHLFPPDFVESWERREVLNNKLGRFNDLQTAALEDLKKTIPSQCLIDHFLFGLRKVFRNIEYAFLKFYLYHRNGLPASQLLIQRAKSFRRFFSR